jgi:hypothetical protein
MRGTHDKGERDGVPWLRGSGFPEEHEIDRAADRKKLRREQAETQERWPRAEHQRALGGRFTRGERDWRLNRDVRECVIGLRALLPDLPPDPRREVEAW